MTGSFLSRSPSTRMDMRIIDNIGRRRPSAATITIWVFVTLEAAGIGYLLTSR